MITLSSVIVEGNYSALPAAGEAGRIFFATDIGAVLYDNGTSWDVVTPHMSYAADTGSANAYAVAFSAIATLIAGICILVKIANANTGASTIAVNGGSAIPIKKQGSSALSGGEMSAGQIVPLCYDGTNFQIIGGGSSSGGFSNPMTTLGDMISAGVGGTATRLAPGTAGYLLQSNGSSAAPSWIAPTASGTVTLNSGDPNTTGGVLVPALVQSASTTTGATATFTNPVVAGNLLVVIGKAQIGTPTGATDSVGTSYTEVGGIQTQSFDNGMTLLVGIAGGSGANTVTLSGGSNLVGAFVAEFSGTITTADVAWATQSGNSSSPTAFSLTATQVDDLILAGICVQSGGPPPSVSTNLTALQSNTAWASGYNVQGSSGAESYAFTFSGSTKWAEFIVALKANPSGALPGVDKAICFDTTASPWQGYCYHSGSWHTFS